MSLNSTPRANRLHIAIFGKRNAGKSSLINALTGQQAALVSEHPGTTTDPVFKAMELHPIGPVVFIDTAGFDDEGELGDMRIDKTREIVKRTDVAVLIFSGDDFTEEEKWLEILKNADIPVISAVGKSDLKDGRRTAELVREKLGRIPVMVSAKQGDGLADMKKAIEEVVPEDYKRRKILGELVEPGQLVVLVMPQDIQAPKGRLILPQVQTIRELLDNRCTTVCTTADRFTDTIECFNGTPALIITDSQCFVKIYEQKPAESRLTSFSVLFAAYKGDIKTFVEGAAAIDSLTENSKVLIAEACTHAPLEEDIGRVKIPRALRKKVGENLQIDMVSGNDFPDDPSEYDLIIHCGACMFNRKHVLSRIGTAASAGVPITNYGVTMARLAGILDKIEIPESDSFTKGV